MPKNRNNQYCTFDEARDLIEEAFNDHGLTEAIDLDAVKDHMAMVDQHEKDIADLKKENLSLKKRVDALEQAAAQQQAQPVQQQAQPVQQQAQAQQQQTQTQQATQQTSQLQQQVLAQQGQQQPQGQQLNSFWIQQMYHEDGCSTVSANLEDAIQAGATNPTLKRCIVNNLNQAAPLTKEQMVVAGFASLTCKV